MKALKTAAAVATFASVLASGQAHAAPPGDRNFNFNFGPGGQKVIFYSYRGNARPDIYVRGPNGEEKNLTARADTWDIEPDYSPDGSKIIYASGPNMGALTLRIMNADGSHDRLFYDGDDNEVAPNWSPDSQWIIFSNKIGDDGQADLYRMRPDGSHRQRLTHDKLSQTSPVYSPSMKTIIFIGFNEDGLSDLYSMPADGLHHGATVTKLSHSDENLEYFLTHTPNGEHLIFSQGDWDKGFEMAHIPAPK